MTIWGSGKAGRRLSNESAFWRGTISPLGNFKFFLHLLIDSGCVGLGAVLLGAHQVQAGWWVFFAMLVWCEGVTSGLVDVVVVAGECLQTCLLVDASI